MLRLVGRDASAPGAALVVITGENRCEPVITGEIAETEKAMGKAKS